MGGHAARGNRIPRRLIHAGIGSPRVEKALAFPATSAFPRATRRCRGYWSERTRRAREWNDRRGSQRRSERWRVAFEEAPHQFPVADIPVDEHVRRVVLERQEICRIARVGELVHVDDRVRALREPVQDEIRAYEAGTACHQDGHLEARSSAFSFAYLLKLFMQPIVMCTRPGTPSRKPSRHR